MKFEIFPVTHYQQNCSLIWCETTAEAALVDPGGDTEALCQRLQALPIKLSKIILTHGHMDHVGGAAVLRGRLNVPIIGPHKDDRFWLQAMEQQAAMMGFESAPAFEPDQWLAQGDTVQVGTQTLDVLHCPGHTPGHVVLFQRQARLAWVGDVLFAGSIGRSDFPGGDHATLVHSIKTQLWPLGDDVRFIPGHGPMSSFGKERRDNPFVADQHFG